MNSCVKNNIYHPIPAESFVYRKRRYPVDFSTPEESHVCISPESFVHLPTPAESNVYRKPRYFFDFSTPAESYAYRNPESFVHLPTPEEGFVYRNGGPSPDFPTPEESHVYRKLICTRSLFQQIFASSGVAFFLWYLPCYKRLTPPES